MGTYEAAPITKRVMAEVQTHLETTEEDTDLSVLHRIVDAQRAEVQQTREDTERGMQQLQSQLQTLAAERQALDMFWELEQLKQSLLNSSLESRPPVEEQQEQLQEIVDLNSGFDDDIAQSRLQLQGLKSMRDELRHMRDTLQSELQEVRELEARDGSE